MEKQSSKSKNKLLSLLPKAAKAASVSFQNPHFSPGREKRANGASHKLKSRLYRAFSGPLISMIPAEAREESKNFETQEPNSPKISCMGQIKHKKMICSQKPVLHSQPERISKAGPAAELKKKKPPLGIKNSIGGRRKSDVDSFNHGKPPVADRAPCLSQAMRFASSRDTYKYFDWTTTDGGGGDYYSGEDWESYSDADGDGDAAVPTFSAPLLVAGAECGGLVLAPRKEINLWKRRATMARLKPLQLNV